MFIYGVVNASPDSLATESIVDSPDRAEERSRLMLADGADGIDLGGQGSTDSAVVVDWEEEWARVQPIVPRLARLGVEVSIDSWRPEVVRHALEAGATVINAADGMQSTAMWEVAADYDVPIIIPFLSGPNPREMTVVRGDPVRTIMDYFAERLDEASRYGLTDRCVLDPGTGFAPPNWAWEQRFSYQKRIYSSLNELRQFGLPLYVALPWKDTDQHDELLEIVLHQQPEYGRAHYPAKVRRVERRMGRHRAHSCRSETKCSNRPSKETPSEGSS